jgi:hypothetical protein
MIEGKKAYKLLCVDYGVVPQSYLSDNNTAFTSHAFELHLENFSQHRHFAGEGTHHHNGHVEQAIRTVMSIARTMMQHSAIHWPEMAGPCPWPMAIQHAVFLYNHMPTLDSGLLPHDLFPRPDGNTGYFWISTSGDALFTFSIRPFQKARRYQNGNQDHNGASRWDYPRNTQHRFLRS